MNSITACPNVLQYCPVLCNIRPVTVTAEVAVYNASIKGVISEFALEIGSFNNMVPENIYEANRYINKSGDANTLEFTFREDSFRLIGLICSSLG